MAKVPFKFFKFVRNFGRKCDILFLYVWPFKGSYIDVQHGFGYYERAIADTERDVGS